MASGTAEDTLSIQLTRLKNLQGVDPGMFVLAVHSFAEAVIRSQCNIDHYDESTFSTLIQAYRDLKIARANGSWVQDLNVLDMLKMNHTKTNQVRHRFETVEVFEAQAATQHLLTFCKLAGIGEDENLQIIKKYIGVWNDRKSYGELLNELSRKEYLLIVQSKKAQELTEQNEALQRQIIHVEELTQEKSKIELALRKYEQKLQVKDKKYDELRASNFQLDKELRDAQKNLTQFDELQNYIQALQKMTVYTRTRMDFERSVIRFTPEQKDVLSAISLKKDFLIKGSAGTGKTLVLLKAIEKAKGRGTDSSGLQDELGLDEIKGSIALLTYTRTLAKYDSYLSELVLSNHIDQDDLISTVDSFLCNAPIRQYRI